MFCRNCGQNIDDRAGVCPNCGTPTQVQSNNFGPGGGYNNQVTDNGGILWGLLGCCIPIVGLILFLIWKDQKPNTAKAAGIGALVSVVLSVIWYIIAFAFGLLDYML